RRTPPSQRRSLTSRSRNTDDGVVVSGAHQLSTPATREDLDAAVATLRGEMATRQDLDALRQDLDAAVATLRGEMATRQDLDALRQNLDAAVATLRGEMAQLEQRLGDRIMSMGTLLREWMQAELDGSMQRMAGVLLDEVAR